MQVILAANDMPSINDITYLELVEIINKVTKINKSYIILYTSVWFLFCNFFQLKDENGKLAGVDVSDLLVANSGNDLPVRISEPDSAIHCGGLISYVDYLRCLNRQQPPLR